MGKLEIPIAWKIKWSTPFRLAEASENMGCDLRQSSFFILFHSVQLIWKHLVSGSFSGVLNDGFLLLTLKTLFRLSRTPASFPGFSLTRPTGRRENLGTRLSRTLVVSRSRNAFKRHHKICIRSIILGELESFRNNKGFSLKNWKDCKSREQGSYLLVRWISQEI